MERRTVTITTIDCAEARDFHLSPEKAERFAARIRAEGGTAIIGPFRPSRELVDMIHNAVQTRAKP
jgi:hypothetical protein